jgi:dTDP-4-dehydrorhamnose 3,5-epimerase
MHFQRPPQAEKKLVMCLRGRVFDVAVDIRNGSPTFLKWHAEVLAPQAVNALLIPEGFAHGFQTLTDDVEMLYCHSAPYAPDHEAGVHPHDPAIGIRWPAETVAMSERDRSHPFLDSSFEGVVV